MPIGRRSSEEKEASLLEVQKARIILKPLKAKTLDKIRLTLSMLDFVDLKRSNEEQRK